MTERSLDELGPVDYLIVEFPAGQQNFTGEGADELLRLHDAGIIRIMDILILTKDEDGAVDAMELSDLARARRDRPARGRARADPRRGRRRAPRRRDGPGQRRRRPGLRERVGRARSPRPCAARAASSSPTAGSRSRPSSPPSRPTRPRPRSNPQESDMPLGPGRRGSASSALPSPRPPPSSRSPSPARRRSPRPPSSAPPCRPGPSPVAKAAVVGAAVTPGRRRF